MNRDKEWEAVKAAAAGAKKRLGRGFAQLMTGGEELLQQRNIRVSELRIGSMQPSRFQPRSSPGEASIADLAASITRTGVLQPIVVRRLPAGDDAEEDAAKYEIIAGERRWRAAKAAGRERIPAYITGLSDAEAAEVALVENMQREDLSAPDVARSIVTLMREHGYTQKDIGVILGMSRPAVTNQIRLLKLPEEVLEMIVQGSLSAGHGRALLALSDPAKQAEGARESVQQGMNVRQLENWVQKQSGRTSAKTQVPLAVTNRVAALRKSLAQGSRDRLVFKPRTASSGEVTIAYRSQATLERVLAALEQAGNDSKLDSAISLRETQNGGGQNRVQAPQGSDHDE